MSEQQFSLNEPGEYFFRTGTANPIEEPSGYSIDGAITAPADFFVGKQRNGYELPLDLSYVIVSPEKGRIELTINDEWDSRRITISGTLKKTKHLKAFQINEDHSFTMQELMRLVKRMKYFFLDTEEHARYLKAISDVHADVSKTIKQQDDLQGNTLYNFVTKVNSEIKGEFKLGLPVFKGLVKSNFRVETILDVTDQRVRFILQSSELFEIEEQLTEVTMERELKRFENLTIVVV